MSNFTFRQLLAPASRFPVIASHTMVADSITVHNTQNDAPAINERNNVVNNSTGTSFHVAVDDREVIQLIPFNRNAWHASDGANGPGNRRSIAVEICFSLSGGARFNQAERNAATYIAQLLHERNWGINRVFTHQHFDPRSQNCPRLTMLNGWQRFLNMVQAELNKLNRPTTLGATHTVRAGETLWAIAQRHNTTVQAIQATNNMGNRTDIFPNQVLQIPVKGGAPRAGQRVQVSNAPLFANATTASQSGIRSGTFYIWSADVQNGRVRVTNHVNRVGVAGQVTGWMRVSDI